MLSIVNPRLTFTHWRWLYPKNHGASLLIWRVNLKLLATQTRRLKHSLITLSSVPAVDLSGAVRQTILRIVSPRITSWSRLELKSRFILMNLLKSTNLSPNSKWLLKWSNIIQGRGLIWTVKTNCIIKTNYVSINAKLMLKSRPDFLKPENKATYQMFIYRPSLNTYPIMIMPFPGRGTHSKRFAQTKSGYLQCLIPRILSYRDRSNWSNTASIYKRTLSSSTLYRSSK